MKKIFLIASLILSLGFPAFAQIVDVNGTVLNAQNSAPIGNKQVIITAISNNGFYFSDTVYTLANGHYTLAMPFPDYLVDTANFLVTVQDCNDVTHYGFGNSATMIVVNNFSICEYCKAVFTVVPDPVDPHTFTFVNTSISPMPTNIVWSFGDGNTSAAWSPTHTYTLAGPYQVVLTIGSPDSISPCTDSAAEFLYVDPLSFKWDTLHACEGVISMAITGKNINNVNVLSLNTGFDPGALAFEGMTYHHPDIQLSNLIFTAGPDFLNINWHNLSPLSFGDDTLFKFDFNFLCSFSGLYWKSNSSAVGPDGSVPANFMNGFVDCCLLANPAEMQEGGILVYPNPAKNQINFSETLSEVMMLDLTGRIVKSENSSKGFSLKGINPGMYFVRYTRFGTTCTQKILVSPAE